MNYNTLSQQEFGCNFNELDQDEKEFIINQVQETY
jgi:hypothetical protein